MPDDVMPKTVTSGPAPEPTPEPAPEPTPEPSEPTAEELKQQLAASQAEVEHLKSALPPSKEEEPEPAPTDRQPIQMTATQAFLHQTMPESKKQYSADTATPADQFDVMINTVDRFVGAVLQDQILPATHQLAAALIESNNEIEMLQLKFYDPAFKGLEATVRKSLGKLTLVDRSKPQAVRNLYYQIRGAKPDGTPVTSPKDPSAVLRDVSAGGGAPRKSSSVRLTADQETERSAIEAEQDTPFTPEQYAAKLKVRQDRAKAAQKTEPKLLRDQ